MLLAELIEDGHKRSTRPRLRASDPQLSSHRIGDEFDVLDPLSEFVKRCNPSPYHGETTLGRMDPAGAAIEKTNTEGMLKVGYRPRHCGLGGTKTFRRLVHATGLGHGHEDAHIT